MGGWCRAATLGLSIVLASWTFGGRGRAAVPAGPLTIVTFGTSVTKNGGWQRQLEAALSDCLKRAVSTVIVAKVGETTRWALTQLDAVEKAKPDIVLVEFAGNDASLHRGFSLSESASNMEKVLKRLQALDPAPRLVVMGMNPGHGPRYWIRSWLPQYVAAHRDVAVRLGVEFVDHRPNWEALPPDVLKRAIPDGIHPDPAVAAQIIVPTLVRLLSRGQCA